MDDMKKQLEGGTTKDLDPSKSENRCDVQNSEIIYQDDKLENMRSSSEDLMAHFPPELLEITPPDVKDRHRQALLQIFATNFHSTGRFGSLLVGSTGNSESFVSWKNRSQGPDEIKNRRREVVRFELDRQLPKKLAQLTGAFCHEDTNVNNSNKDGCVRVGNDLHNQTCVALTLNELEFSTRQWYLSTVEKRKKNEVGGKFNQTPNARSDSRPSASFFSLKYNEGSLLTISKWCSSRSSQADSKKEKNNVSPSKFSRSKPGRNVSSNALPRRGASSIGNSANKELVPTGSGLSKYPTVDKRFRKCSICKHWGHYEVECSMLSFAETMHFSNILQSSRPPVSDKREQASLSDPQTTVSQQTNTTNSTSSQNKDKIVTLEFFGGYMFEQRSQPEIRRCESQEFISDDVVLPYDDSFIVDGFALKAATSLKELKSGEASCGTLPRKAIGKKHVSTSIRINEQLGAFHPVEFFEGDLVAWYEKFNPIDEGNDRTIHTGYVVKVPKRQNPKVDDSSAESVCVENLTSIPYSPESIYLEKSSKIGNISSNATSSPEEALHRSLHRSGCGSKLWIPTKDLFLVQERARIIDADEVRGKKRKYNARKKIEPSHQASQLEELPSDSKSPARIQKSNKVSKSRSMPYSERFKESGRVQSKDMSLAPRKPARRLADGTYSMPQGRRPGKLISQIHTVLRDKILT
jgi:hypothetical protein